MMNIPIYRALKLGTKDEYVEGYYFCDTDVGVSVVKLLDDTNEEIVIDDMTLSIHFPDMLDSENNKIFASLAKDGRGGSILLYEDSKDIRELICTYQYYRIDLRPINIIKDSYNFKGCTLNEQLKIIGINK